MPESPPDDPAASRVSVASAPSSVRAADDRTDVDAIVALHSAEYQALVARSTNWITIQMALWPVMAGLLLLMVEARGKVPDDFLAWGGSVLILVVMLAYHSASFEQYNNIRYIELVLKPLIRHHVRDPEFWGYEPWLQSHRGLSPVWWEYLPLAFPVAGILGAAYYQVPWSSVVSGIGILLSLGLLVADWRLARTCVATRRAMIGSPPPRRG
jgi:hypothetical protein